MRKAHRRRGVDVWDWGGPDPPWPYVFPGIQGRRVPGLPCHGRPSSPVPHGHAMCSGSSSRPLSEAQPLSVWTAWLRHPRKPAVHLAFALREASCALPPRPCSPCPSVSDACWRCPWPWRALATHRLPPRRSLHRRRSRRFAPRGRRARPSTWAPSSVRCTSPGARRTGRGAAATPRTRSAPARRASPSRHTTTSGSRMAPLWKNSSFIHW